MTLFNACKENVDRQGYDSILSKTYRIAIIFTIFSAVVFMGYDPGYHCEYYMENKTQDTIAYKLYWRSHNLHLKTGKSQKANLY